MGATALSLGCPTGHSFDANRRGYLNLVDRSRGISGDTRAILDSRDRFLRSGHYSPIVELLDSLMPVTAAPSILDSGCGTGYYLAGLAGRRPDWDPLVLDVSVDAVAMAVRAAGAPGLVTDVWRLIPVRSARADVILCVFAPRNPAEFARILRPGGRLLVVTPSEHHLGELRLDGRLIGMQADKLAHLDAALGSDFALLERQSLSYKVALSEQQVEDLTGMGPTGHHRQPKTAAPAARPASRLVGETAVTVAVDASVFVSARSGDADR